MSANFKDWPSRRWPSHIVGPLGAAAEPPVDDSETRVAILGLDEHEEDIRGTVTQGNLLQYDEVVDQKLDWVWEPDFDEGRNDDCYHITEAAPPPVEDTQAFLEQQEDEPEWYEDFLAQDVEDVAPQPEDSETRVVILGLDEDEEDIRGFVTIGNVLSTEGSESYPWTEDVRHPEEIGESTGNLLGFTTDEIFYLAQELLQADPSDGVDENWFWDAVLNLLPDDPPPAPSAPQQTEFIGERVLTRRVESGHVMKVR